ncbi:Dephospho-CoA kinase [uncultured archaeon]|nr:Dephospho-CoA kinase [uncultured archaeon]
MKKIVLTGGPCSGKSTVLEELAKKGYSVLRETAKEIVAKRKDIPISKQESEIRQDMIFNEQLKKEEEAEKGIGVLFLDRSLIDGLGYSVLYEGENSLEKYFPKILGRKYHKIFLFERLPFSSQGFRPETNEEAKKIHDAMDSIYKRFGYEPISVPKMSVEERVNFILGIVFEGYY